MSFPSPSQRQAGIIWMAGTGLASLIIIAVIVAFVWGIGQVLQVLAPVLWPLAIAGVLAYLLDPVVDWFEKRGLSRTRSIVMVFFIVAGLLLAVVSNIVPRVVVEGQELVSKVPEYSKSVQARIEELLANPPDLLRRILGTEGEAQPVEAPTPQAAPATTNNIDSGQQTNVNIPPEGRKPAKSAESPRRIGPALDASTIASLSEKLATVLPQVGGLLKQLGSMLVSWVGLLAGLALIPVYLFYFLLEKKAIAGHWAQYLPLKDSNIKDELVFVIRAINDHLIAFFRGQVLVAICDSILYTIGFLIIGMDYAFLIGFCAVFLTIIPYIGAFIICASAMLLAFAQFGDFTHTLLPLRVFAVVQAIEGFILQPKILGDKVGLHPLIIIIAVIAGTTLLGGVLGGILAIPVAAALRVVLYRYVWVNKPEAAA